MYSWEFHSWFNYEDIATAVLKIIRIWDLQIHFNYIRFYKVSAINLYLKTHGIGKRTSSSSFCFSVMCDCSLGVNKRQIKITSMIKWSRLLRKPPIMRCLHNPFHQKHHVLCVCLSRFRNGGLVSCLFDCSALLAIQTLAASPLITTCYQAANKTDKADSMSSELSAPPSSSSSSSLFHYLNMRHTHMHRHTCYL